MKAQTPAAEQNRLREQLDWAARLWALQPAALKAQYERSAREIVDALVQPTYSLTVTLPDHFAMDNADSITIRHRLVVRVGNALNRIREIPCNPLIITALGHLASDPDEAVSSIGRLVNYLVAESLLKGVPDTNKVREDFSPFDARKRRLLTSEAQAERAINQLSYDVELLHLIESLYPGWTASDDYNEKYSQITGQLTEQGRALASHYIDQMIDELTQQSQAGTIARGLTLYVPYLDERTYQMAKYKLVVMPVGRIPFRPEFVVSACRVAQREVRQDQQFSQTTRWELISALDRVIQAFDAKPDS